MGSDSRAAAARAQRAPATPSGAHPHLSGGPPAVLGRAGAATVTIGFLWRLHQLARVQELERPVMEL